MNTATTQDTERRCADCPSREPQRIITARMPKSLHAQLREAAHQRHVSMNELCLTFLRAGLADDQEEAAETEA